MRIVFIGAGKIIKWFLNNIKNSKYHEQIQPYGIYNCTLEKDVEYQKNYHLEKVYHSLEELISNRDNYDLVYVGTNNESLSNY